MDSCLRTEQFFTLIVICLISFGYYYRHQSYQNSSIAYNIPDPECTGIFNICTDIDKERLGRQSIRAIHEQMDDDKDGLVQSSEIYNWTTDNVVDWLVNFAHLPQYVENFRRNQFDGRMIPRLGANEKHYISSVIHIRDVRDKRRLIIKAADLVLFGPSQS
ncbi:unnamed protein product [Rotaria magnacalcarata]|uniref:SAM domain-containing protein n=1 Tax=Rotaria magnacalcarata TaxID=392030 RepID=A0A8S3CCH2_9BILA|nr:unnamed protein product [Rotaria magnacalcarata]